jgi:hypothetical protein
MFIQKGLYFISNEVLLINKKLENYSIETETLKDQLSAGINYASSI